MNNDYEELFRELNLNLKDNSQQHDMAKTIRIARSKPKVYEHVYGFN